MHTVRTRRLLREIAGPDTGSMSTLDRETVMPISLAIGVAVVALLAGCQQFAGKTIAAAARPATAVLQPAEDAHDSQWISRLHVQAAKSGSSDSLSDLSY